MMVMMERQAYEHKCQVVARLVYAAAQRETGAYIFFPRMLLARINKFMLHCYFMCQNSEKVEVPTFFPPFVFIWYSIYTYVLACIPFV